MKQKAILDAGRQMATLIEEALIDKCICEDCLPEAERVLVDWMVAAYDANTVKPQPDPELTPQTCASCDAVVTAWTFVGGVYLCRTCTNKGCPAATSPCHQTHRAGHMESK